MSENDGRGSNYENGSTPESKHYVTNQYNTAHYSLYPKAGKIFGWQKLLFTFLSFFRYSVDQSLIIIRGECNFEISKKNSPWEKRKTSGHLYKSGACNTVSCVMTW